MTDKPSFKPSLPVTPLPKQWQKETGFFTLTASSRLAVNTRFRSAILPAAWQFSDDISRLNQLQLAVIEADTPEPGDILLSLSAASASPEAADEMTEAYSLAVADTLAIQSDTCAGLVRGMATVLQLLKMHHPDRVSVPYGQLTDGPLCRERGLMLDVGRYYFSLSFIKDLIRLIAWHKCNILHLHFSDDLGFRLKSDIYPELASSQAYSKAEIREIQDFADLYKVMIIPEIDLPAHAGHIRKVFPELGNDDPSLEATTNTQTLSLVKDKARELVKNLLDEWVPLFDAPYFHVGTDEWPDWSEQPERLNQMLDQAEILKAYARQQGLCYPADVYIQFINEINGQVKGHGKRLRIWEGFNRLQRSLEPDQDILIEPWTPDQAQAYLDQGYEIINPTGEYLYLVPGLYYRWPPAPSLDQLFSEWHPGRFKQDHSLNVEVTAKGFLGAKLCIWTDVAQQAGVTETMVFGHLYPHLQIFAAKTWGSVPETEYQAFRDRVDPVGLPPGCHLPLVINDHAQGKQLNQFSFSTGWSLIEQQDRPVGNDIHQSDQAGSTCRIRFRGDWVALVARTGPSLGMMALSIDGLEEQLADLYAPETRDGCPVFDSGPLACTEHILTLRVTGKSNPRSAGTTVTVDAAYISECFLPTGHED